MVYKGSSEIMDTLYYISQVMTDTISELTVLPQFNFDILSYAKTTQIYNYMVYYQITLILTPTYFYNYSASASVSVRPSD